MSELDVAALEAVLTRTAEMSAVEVALGIAAAGVPVLPTVPGDKKPMLTTEHIVGVDKDGEVIGAACEACRAAGLRPAAEHGATRDADRIRQLWQVHPDAGVGMKNHPRLVRGDGDHADGAELRRSWKLLRYGEPNGEPMPMMASTPGGSHRRRYLHLLPEGVPAPGGGTSLLGVSWYGDSGMIVVKGRHPTSGTEYPPFHGRLTAVPEALRLDLVRRGTTVPSTGSAASGGDVATFLATHTGRGRLSLLDQHRSIVAMGRQGERHHLAIAQLVAGFREAVAGLVPAQLVVDVVRDGLAAAGWETSRFAGEFDDLVAWAVAQVAHLTPDDALEAISKRRDEYLAAQAEANVPEALLDYWEAQVGRDFTDDELDRIDREHRDPDPDDDEEERLERDGATFILDEPAELEPRWGAGNEVLWARGETLMIPAPPGVGKTTMAGQVVRGLIGARSHVLGYPIKPARRVLYLAMDRPRQIRRSLRRQFTEADRELLAERLVIRPGPLPTDLAKVPDQLLTLARAHGCDVVIVDSLKDAAVKLTDDETAGQVNRAFQHCAAADVDVLVLHHQRKGQNGEKPTSLADVYGSTWITAGVGSVILLWGEPGSELVELIHLKQPAEPVGPLQLEHDHHLGDTTVRLGFDALAFLRHRGAIGATVAEAAQAEHGTPVSSGSAKWKRTERRLRNLVRQGLATHQPAGHVGGQGRYFPVDTPRGHAVFAGTVDRT